MSEQMNKFKRTPATTGTGAINACAKHVLVTALVLRTVKTPGRVP